MEYTNYWPSSFKNYFCLNHNRHEAVVFFFLHVVFLRTWYFWGRGICLWKDKGNFSVLRLLLLLSKEWVCRAPYYLRPQKIWGVLSFFIIPCLISRRLDVVICRSHFGASEVPFIVCAKMFLLELIYSLCGINGSRSFVERSMKCVLFTDQCSFLNISLLSLTLLCLFPYLL